MTDSHDRQPGRVSRSFEFASGVGGLVFAALVGNLAVISWEATEVGGSTVPLIVAMIASLGVLAFGGASLLLIKNAVFGGGGSV